MPAPDQADIAVDTAIGTSADPAGASDPTVSSPPPAEGSSTRAPAPDVADIAVDTAVATSADPGPDQG